MLDLFVLDVVAVVVAFALNAVRATSPPAGAGIHVKYLCALEDEQFDNAGRRRGGRARGGDHEPVETLRAYGVDEALGDRVCLRLPHRRFDDLDAFACEDGVEAAAELAVAAAYQGPTRPLSLLERPGEDACLLGDPGTGWVGGAAGKMNPAAPELDEEEQYSRGSEIVSTVKKSTASMLCACCRRNARQEIPDREPAGPRPASRRIFFTVLADTARPRPFISPTIRW
jgi:hypothetical protein